MTIVATVHSDNPQYGRNKRWLTFKYVDHLSNTTYSSPKLVDNSYVPDLVSLGLVLDQSLGDNELSSISDPLLSYENPVYTTADKVAQSIARKVLLSVDIDYLISVLPFYDSVKAANNTNQLKALLALTAQELTNFNSKMNSVSGVESIITVIKTMITEVD
jgi:hypothetical protein